MNDFFDIASEMAQALRDIVDVAIDDNGDPAAMMPEQILLDEFDELTRHDRLMSGAGQGGPFVRAVTLCVDAATQSPQPSHHEQTLDDWHRAYVDAIDHGWTMARMGVYDDSNCARQPAATE